MSTLARDLAALAFALALTGCAALPAPTERMVTHADSDVAGTTLARIASASAPADRPDLSGFRLLGDDGDALDARLELLRRAEKTIDVQYYLIAHDATGLGFLGALGEAAARGVRVRVLVDDLYATSQDATFAAFATQANVELRLFNPLPARGGSTARRVALSLRDFGRINHRMHNKLLIVDGSFAITGGRNIADEYFDRSGTAHFIDMDLLSSGAVVAELAAVFDRFWNSPYAYPVQQLVTAPSGTDPIARPRFATRSALAIAFDAGRLDQRFAPARVLADSPEKVLDDVPGPDDSPVMQAHLDLLGSARTSVLVATPYFVPGADGLAALREARSHDARFTIMTNSLATTDEPLVHFGYARDRPTLLRLGVVLHELMPVREDDDEAGEHASGSLGRLHAKVVVVDDRWLSIGSMNMDRRSARSNTETAIVIDDPVLAREAIAFLERGLAAGSYALRLGEGGQRIEWVDRAGQAAIRKEPKIRGGPGLRSRLASFFVSEEML